MSNDAFKADTFTDRSMCLLCSLISDPSHVKRVNSTVSLSVWWHCIYLSLSCPKLGGGGLCVFIPLCGTTASDLCTFEHAELNCASCSNSITPASTQVPHWSNALLDGVIQPVVHFIVYTPRNGDICKKANKNIPPARNAPGISSPTPGYDSLSALVCFHRPALFQREWILIPYSWMALCFSKWMTLKTRLDAFLEGNCWKLIDELFWENEDVEIERDVEINA